MKVAINAKLLYAPTLRGWNRYAVSLLSELSRAGVRLFLYSDRPLHSSHLERILRNSYEVRIAPPMRYFLWEQSWLPRQCAADAVDILHSPFNYGLPWSSPCPKVLTLHDSIDEAFYGRRRTWAESISRASIQTRLYHWVARTRADRIITVSQHSKQDLVNYLNVPAERIEVVYEAADDRFQEPPSEAIRRRVREAYGLPSRYVLYVGGWEDRKNIPFLLRAFAMAQLSDEFLVLAGGTDKQINEIKLAATALGIGKRLVILGWVTDEDLAALYAEALCFVYPSMYEGFGLQLCEAMAAGCPVLAADATCLPEILGTGGSTFSLAAPNELARLLELVAKNEGFRNSLIANGHQRARAFTWRKTADQTIAVYEKLISSSGENTIIMTP